MPGMHDWLTSSESSPHCGGYSPPMEDTLGVVWVSVEAILEVYNPWYTLGLHKSETKTRVRRAVPHSEHIPEEDRNRDYHFGRIREFVRLLEAGQDLDPIEMALCPKTGLPVLVDGNHRLIAHSLVGNGIISVRNSPCLREFLV